MSIRNPLNSDIYNEILFLNKRYLIVPAIDLNLNQKFIQSFYNLCNDREILKLADLAFFNKNYSYHHAKQFLETSIMEFGKRRKTFYLMEHFIVGVFEFKDLSSSPEIGYFLKKSLRGKGLGKLFVSKMIDCYSNEYQSILAKVRKENQASLRILHSLQFKIINSKNDIYTLIKEL